MKTRTLLLAVLALCAIVGILSVPAFADTGTNYVNIFSGPVGNETLPNQYNGCIVTFSINNGSSVHVTVQNPDYATADGVIPAGQTFYYNDLLRIYVATPVGNGTAQVSIDKPSGSGTSTATGTILECDTPGQNALGGDVVTFPVSIQNNLGVDTTYTLGASSDTGWGLSFEYGGKNVYQLFVPSGQSKQVDLVVQTAYDSSIGQKSVQMTVQGASMILNVDITSINQSANVGVQVGSMIANIGDKIYYQMSIQNLQSQQNNYMLSITGLPANWYYQYAESTTSSDQLAELAVPAQSTKNFVLQILPPNSVNEGEYNFTAVITTPDNVTISEPLSLRLNGGVSMTYNYNQLAYTSGPGQQFTIPIYISNSGNGGALTNVYPDITAPSGWIVSSSPNSTNTIKAGQMQEFTISVQSPGNIAPSDYDVNVVVKSDQAQSSEDFRITIASSSIIPYIGGGIILVIVVGLVLMYRKYGRR